MVQMFNLKLVQIIAESRIKLTICKKSQSLSVIELQPSLNVLVETKHSSSNSIWDKAFKNGTKKSLPQKSVSHKLYLIHS